MNNPARALLAFLIALAGASSLSAQSGLFTCAVNSAVPPLLRQEGLAEQVGDILVICTGGSPGEVRFANIDLFLNTNITSRITDPATGETEALLLIDDPRPGISNTSNGMTYPGQVKGVPGINPGVGGGIGNAGSGNIYQAVRSPSFPNRLTWNGVPIVPPGANQQRVIRITNVRADATQLPGSPLSPATISGFLNISPQNSLPLGSPQVLLGSILPGMTFEVIGVNNIQLRFREAFASAFKKRIQTTPGSPTVPALQATPGVLYNTESGLTPEYTNVLAGDLGVATTGTRLIARFTGLPAGVQIQAPNSAPYAYPAGPGGTSEGGLELRRVTMFDASFSGGVLAPSGGQFQPVDIINGAVDIVYEVVSADPLGQANGSAVIDEFIVPVFLSTQVPNVNLRDARVQGALCPLDGRNTMSADAPRPRFRATSDPAPILARPAPSSLTFNFTLGGAAPEPISFFLQGAAVAEPGVATQTGGDWLAAIRAPRTLSEYYTVFVFPAGLAAGSYNGAVTIPMVEGAARVIPVVLNVLQPGELIITTTPLAFPYRIGQPAPAAQIVYMTARYQAVSFTAAATTASGGNWLSVSPASGSTPVNFSIRASPGTLAPGAYSGTVTITAPGASNSPQSIPVTLLVTGDNPVIAANGIVNAASFAFGAVAPQTILTVFGNGMGVGDLRVGIPGPDGKYPATLADTRILFDGEPGPLIYVSDRQASVIAPSSIAGKAVVRAVVEYRGLQSAVFALNVAAAFPGIFTLNSAGTGQGAILNEDYRVNSTAAPAYAGQVIRIYGTGFGLPQPPGQDGALVDPAAPLPRITAPVRVFIGGREAEVLYAGATPGSVLGLIQVDARVSRDAPAGDAVPVEITVGDRSTQPGVTMVVR